MNPTVFRALKEYIDAKIAFEIRQQAWLKLSFTDAGDPSPLSSAKRSLEAALASLPIESGPLCGRLMQLMPGQASDTYCAMSGGHDGICGKQYSQRRPR